MRTAGQVLVVDDDAATVEFLKRTLHEEGYFVIAVDNAGAALDAAMTLWDRQPDAILLSVQLPTVDGRDFAELYRLLPVQHAPIILMATSSKAADVAVQIQAQDMLIKPFSVDEVLTRLRRATVSTVSQLSGAA